LLTGAIEEISKLSIDCGTASEEIKGTMLHVPTHLWKVQLPPVPYDMIRIFTKILKIHQLRNWCPNFSHLSGS
jgi:hypothetical protein